VIQQERPVRPPRVWDNATFSRYVLKSRAVVGGGVIAVKKVGEVGREMFDDHAIDCSVGDSLETLRLRLENKECPTGH
jgi:hypothetical protein